MKLRYGTRVPGTQIFQIETANQVVFTPNVFRDEMDLETRQKL